MRPPPSEAPRGRRIPWAAVVWLGLLITGPVCAALLPAGMDAPMRPPDFFHWLGTDWLGRDLLRRLLEGGARTLGVAGGACALSVMLGGAWGVTAGYAGGWLDQTMNRVVDAALAVPALLLALVVVAALGAGDAPVLLAVGLGGAATFARLARSEAAQIRHREYMEAARLLGAGHARLIVRHLMPNILPALAAYAAVHFGWAILTAAALTFLGFGGAPATPDWGRMLADARLVFWEAPWQAIAPGLAIGFTVLAAQQIGERLSERREA